MYSTNKTIIAAAEQELTREGENFETMAGVPWIENEHGDFQPARPLEQSETLALAIEKLGDDGRMYCTYTASLQGAADFIEAASTHGLEEQATAITLGFFS